ncbi:tagaturonate epimerase family protein [Desnuesiella massiliensis]|uniref:tagaturonate epimerase family protein n=1 Tax=Desnuesiella massiliensis TaxID=1650662 RepID=UPI000A8B868C|nr:tagaturonate epimerase family protein [Desnuesiella massiliensis]
MKKDIYKIFEENSFNMKENHLEVYTESIYYIEETLVSMVKLNGKKYLMVNGDHNIYGELDGKFYNNLKLCPLTHENRLVLNKYFDFTIPKAFGKNIATMGLGDRLGMASVGHIKTIKNRDVRPILAQQSIRELNLTGRTYEEVLDCACFAAFQEGYKQGFGADGDHLKEEQHIKLALDLGFSMITLDCSEKINNHVEKYSPLVIKEKYENLPNLVKNYYEDKYLKKSFKLMNNSLTYSKEELMKYVLVYRESIDFIVYIYDKYISNHSLAVDFEVSIDETTTPTTPLAHYFVGKELVDRGVDVNSMAPRFCGEFQKGIDYIGDKEQFEREFRLHAEISDYFGYKISIHSGSDKFSVFPIIAKYTAGRFHVKTAGTNWLEAMRVIAEERPELYRRMHSYALEHFEEAKAYYHVTTDLNKIKALDKVQDSNLKDYLEEDNARQLIHITYGILLQAKDEKGESLFKKEFYNALEQLEKEYDNVLIKHIGKHLSLLGK